MKRVQEVEAREASRRQEGVTGNLVAMGVERGPPVWQAQVAVLPCNVLKRG